MITRVRLVRATDADVREGLLGWLSFVIDGSILVDSVGLRRTASGELTLAYPERKSRRRGIRHPIVAPLAEKVRQGIERQVLAAVAAEVEH